MAMDPVLTSASSMLCSHAAPPAPPGTPPAAPFGKGKVIVPPAPALTVNGAAVLTVGGDATITATCTQPSSSGPPVTKKCSLVTSYGGGTPVLMVGGRQVLRAGAFTAATDGLPTPTFTVSAGHDVLQVQAL